MGESNIFPVRRRNRFENRKIPITTPSIAPIVNALDSLFWQLNDKYFESSLSKCVIAISEKGRRNAYGWCTCDKVWQGDAERHYEINICPEYLNRPIEDICETLLHEMIHLKNLQDNINDTSRNGFYHNKEFKI